MINNHILLEFFIKIKCIHLFPQFFHNFSTIFPQFFHNFFTTSWSSIMLSAIQTPVSKYVHGIMCPNPIFDYPIHPLRAAWHNPILCSGIWTTSIPRSWILLITNAMTWHQYNIEQKLANYDLELSWHEVLMLLLPNKILPFHPYMIFSDNITIQYEESWKIYAFQYKHLLYIKKSLPESTFFSCNYS